MDCVEYSRSGSGFDPLLRIDFALIFDHDIRAIDARAAAESEADDVGEDEDGDSGMGGILTRSSGPRNFRQVAETPHPVGYVWGTHLRGCRPYV